MSRNQVQNCPRKRRQEKGSEDKGQENEVSRFRAVNKRDVKRKE